MPGNSEKRNLGISLDLDWVDAVRVNRSAVERRCSTLVKRRSIKKEWQATWLLKAIRCMDLTTLSSDDTPGRVQRLCSKALRPLKQDLLGDLGIRSLKITVGAVCVPLGVGSFGARCRVVCSPSALRALWGVRAV